MSLLRTFLSPWLSLHKLGFIYLTTGANGTGKTAFTLQAVREMQLKENRPVYWNGRFDLVSDFGWTKIDAKDWQKAPDGAIFFFDECHNDFPTRPTNSAVPSFVAGFGEHRKRGFDFFLLTQHPGNIDPFIRKIIATPGWHRHLKRNFGTSLVSLLEFNAVCDRPEKPGAGKSATVSMRALPKEVYDWYKSAELHTVKRRIPPAVWVFLACCVVVPVLAWYAIHNLRKTAGMDGKPAQAGQAAGGPVGGAGAAGHVLTSTEYVASYEPRIPSLMHTAPAYDKLTEPRRVPVPAACVEMKADRLGGKFGCKCYTQDATPYPVDLSMCRQLVAHGAFLAFLPEGEKAGAGALGDKREAAMPVKVSDKRQEGPQDLAQQPSGLIVMDGAAAARPVAQGVAPDLGSQPRVQAGSPWTFQSK